MAAFWFDLRQVLRSVRRQPAFFAVAALTLGVGFAAHFAAFGIVDRLLLSPPPHVEAADRVFRLHIERADIGGGRFLWWQTPYKAYQELREHDAVVQRDGCVSRHARQPRHRRGRPHGRRSPSPTTTTSRCSVCRPVAAGCSDRTTTMPPSGTPVLVLSDAYWRSAFGADDARNRTDRPHRRADLHDHRDCAAGVHRRHAGGRRCVGAAPRRSARSATNLDDERCSSGA